MDSPGEGKPLRAADVLEDGGAQAEIERDGAAGQPEPREVFRDLRLPAVEVDVSHRHLGNPLCPLGGVADELGPVELHLELLLDPGRGTVAQSAEVEVDLRRDG